MGKCVSTSSGLTVGLAIPRHGAGRRERSLRLRTSPTATNNEIGFDYLRDNMVTLQRTQWCQRGHNFAIVDEVDSILIDEAQNAADHFRPGRGVAQSFTTWRTALSKTCATYACADDERQGDYDGPTRTAITSSMKSDRLNAHQARRQKSRAVLQLGEPRAIRRTSTHSAPHQSGDEGERHHEARYRLRRASDGEVIIVDEFTGRLMYGRRYNEGLHQAIEAKEGVSVAQRKQDACNHHVPEFLPPLQQALRHDRHGHDRRSGVQRNLQTGRCRDSDKQADDP